MGRTARLPLRPEAVRAAHNAFYAKHPEMVDEQGRRQGIDPANADHAAEWLDLYKDNGGRVEETPEADKRPDQAFQPCKLQPRIRLVELVEVVDRGPPAGEGVVEYPGPGSEEKETQCEREDQHDGNYKQYINLTKDLDGQAQRHPEYDRYIELRARVEWAEGDTNKPLTGHRVFFTFTRKNGKGRPQALAGWQGDGFGAARAASVWKDTDEDGWTEVVQFYVSQYGGDKYVISAQAEEEFQSNQATGPRRNIGTYEVWRKFWYQVTRPTTMNTPSLARAVSGWEKVKADMVARNEATYAPGDAPAGTFYPEWMIKGGQGNQELLVSGRHNRDFLYGKYNAEAAKPVKAHLILCHSQGDARLSEQITTGWLSRNQFDHSVDVANDGIVVDPPLSSLAMMAHQGTYQVRQKPSVKQRLWAAGPAVGPSVNLAAANFSVVQGRRGVNYVRITLPVGVPGDGQQVKVSFRAQYMEDWSGEANGYQIMCSTRQGPNTFNDTVVHETGHAFGQVPAPGQQSPSLGPHKNHYEKNGGHCNTGTPGIRKCVMFESGHWTNAATFCDVCNRYVRLKDMSTIKQPT